MEIEIIVSSWLSLTITLWLLPGSRSIFDIHTLLFAARAIIVGFQAVAFAVFIKIFAISEGLLPEDNRLNKVFRYINLEVGLIVGSIILLSGIAPISLETGFLKETRFLS